MGLIVLTDPAHHLYMVRATRTLAKVERGTTWTTTQQVPTFYVEAMTNLDAHNLALSILEPGGPVENVSLTIGFI